MALVHSRGEVPVVKVSGDLDLMSAPMFRGVLGQVVRGQSVPEVVVVDLGGVGFMDSCGVNALIGETRGFVAGGGKVRLVTKASPVVRTLSITGLDKIFEVYPDIGSASCRGVA
ncbi:MAG: anti-sigma factor antagonist [Rubrobacter sp.]|nr:anti-sigma factor antagonist [Rubrobacter sp.]